MMRIFFFGEEFETQQGKKEEEKKILFGSNFAQNHWRHRELFEENGFCLFLFLRAKRERENGTKKVSEREREREREYGIDVRRFEAFLLGTQSTIGNRL